MYLGFGILSTSSWKSYCADKDVYVAYDSEALNISESKKV